MRWENVKWITYAPERRYPSWRDVWQSLFPYVSKEPCPEEWFGERCPSDMECYEYVARSISKYIAEKLGITEQDVPTHNGCKWENRHIDEEPCKNCRGVSNRPAPDLWEKR